MKTLLEAYGFAGHIQLVAWLVKEYGIHVDHQANNPHRMRREAMAQRLRLYRDKGKAEFERVIDLVFETADVRSQRKKMVKVATEQNVTQRIAHEVASLYDQPAVRLLADASKQEAFKELCIELELDEVMQQAQRLTFVCNETLMWRTTDDDGDELRIITPDSFDAIPDPARKLKAIGFLIDSAPAFVPQGVNKATLPHYEVWDTEYRYLINADGKLVNPDGSPASEPIKHGLGRIPGVLFHRLKPSECLMDEHSGGDITSAHLGVGLLEIMAMRLMKAQGEKQPVLRGNLASLAKGQTMDGERPLLLPPEVIAEILDTQTDPAFYIAKKKDKISGVASTYGLSYAQVANEETSEVGSGKAYQIKRQKLTELRNEQRRRWLVQEREVVELLDYDSAGLTVDYREQTIPMDATEEMALLKDMIKLGLDSPQKWYGRKNPDLSKKQVKAAIKENLGEYAEVVNEVRALNMPADADADNPGKSPQENGANNAPQSDAPDDKQARAFAQDHLVH